MDSRPTTTGGTTTGGVSTFESVSGEVVDAAPRNDGSQQWQAELLFTYGTQLGASGRQRSMTIRGPYRTDQDQVKEDLDQLLRAADKGDMKEVREFANNLKRARIR